MRSDFFMFVICVMVILPVLATYTMLAIFSKKIILMIEGVKGYQYETTKHLNKNILPPMKQDKERAIGYAHTPSKDVLGVIRGEYDEMFDQD